MHRTALFRPLLLTRLAPLALGLLSTACGASSDDDADARRSVVENYVSNVTQNYADVVTSAEDMNDAIQAFVAEPSEASLKKARKAWLSARDPYGMSEAYRFYQGPIDNDDSDDDVPEGPEPLLNSWPLDESYIDYVVDADGNVVDGGIINLPSEFPDIDADSLSAENAKQSETTITTGYHAIEFLLWGQDLSEDGPGDRPYTDYVTGDDGTHETQDRRAQYLLTISQLLVDDVREVNDAWQPNADYRTYFSGLPADQAIGKMLLGMGSLSGAELSGERMRVAYDNKDQEDEHSCFSDNTLADLHDNATSVQDVLLGRYGDSDGPGIDDLVAAKDPKLAQRLRDQIQEALDDIDAIDEPFDVAIMGSDSTPERQHIKAAIEALQAFTDSLTEAAKVLGVTLDLQQ